MWCLSLHVSCSLRVMGTSRMESKLISIGIIASRYLVDLALRSKRLKSTMCSRQRLPLATLQEMITTTTAGLTIPQRELSCLAHCGKCTRWPVTANNSTSAQSQNVRSILNYTTQLESSNICARSWHAKQLTTYGYKYDENYESETTANLD